MIRVRAVRRARGMSQVELARRAGLTQKTISDVELNRRPPRTSTMEKIAAALDERVENLITVFPDDPNIRPIPTAEEEPKLALLLISDEEFAARVEAWDVVEAERALYSITAGAERILELRAGVLDDATSSADIQLRRHYSRKLEGIGNRFRGRFGKLYKHKERLLKVELKRLTSDRDLGAAVERARSLTETA